VGGSAGVLDAYIRLLRHLAPDMGVAVVVVNHLRTVATRSFELAGGAVPDHRACPPVDAARQHRVARLGLPARIQLRSIAADTSGTSVVDATIGTVDIAGKFPP
jgi:hypothetical protein